MRIHRLFHVLLLLSGCILLLLGRLLYLQAPAGLELFGPAKVNMSSVRQRSNGVMVDSGRGMIVDKGGHPLTGQTVDDLLLLPGGAERANSAELQRLAEVLAVPRQMLLDRWRAVAQPEWWHDAVSSALPAPAALTLEQARAIRELRLEGALVAPKVNRYPEERLAEHLIGFLAEQPERVRKMYSRQLADGIVQLSAPVGASGLELAFDRMLLGNGGTRIVSYVDGRGQRLAGLGMKTVTLDDRYYPLQLVTTIDAGIQRSMEQTIDRAGLKEGAVVVLDAGSADIVAMASRPHYDAARIDAQGDDWANRAIRSVAPGSVMKTFIAAVALEEGVAAPEEQFHCDGTYPKYGLTCWKEGGHGTITFEEALAQSCNLVFAEVGERLDGPTIQRYAEAYGLLGTAGWTGTSAADGSVIRQFPEELPSKLFVGEAADADGGILAQTAIGQRDVRWSPLLAANWIVTLLHGGRAHMPRAVSELRYADGHALERYPVMRQSAGGRMSPATVHALRRMMADVVADGTGSALQSAVWPLAGKSGTAQVAAGGRAAVHQWFVGYGPADRPRYAVAVLAAHRPPESANQAALLFRDVMNVLAETE